MACTTPGLNRRSGIQMLRFLEGVRRVILNISGNPFILCWEREKEALIEQTITQIVHINHLAELLAHSKPSVKVYCHCCSYCYSLILGFHIHQ